MIFFLQVENVQLIDAASIPIGRDLIDGKSVWKKVKVGSTKTEEKTTSAASSSPIKTDLAIFQFTPSPLLTTASPTTTTAPLSSTSSWFFSNPFSREDPVNDTIRSPGFARCKYEIIFHLDIC